MNPTVQVASRQLVPRWRPLSQTIPSKELFSPSSKEETGAVSPLPQGLVTSLERWRMEPNTVHAAELVETAIAYGHDHEAVNASRFLIQGSSNARKLVRKQAELLLRRAGHAGELAEEPRTEVSVQTWRARTRNVRRPPCNGAIGRHQRAAKGCTGMLEDSSRAKCS